MAVGKNFAVKEGGEGGEQRGGGFAGGGYFLDAVCVVSGIVLGQAGCA